MRRLRKPRPEVRPETRPESKRSIVKKSPGVCSPLALPEIPPGEDDVSFKRHNRILQAEWHKPKRNIMVIEELMEKTFAMRRREILSNSCNVQTLFKKFPFLQDPEQVIVVIFLWNNVCVYWCTVLFFFNLLLY